MQNKKIKTFGLTIIAFAMTLFAVQAADALLVYPANGTATKFDLNNVQRITFSNGEMLVKPFDSNATAFTIENISKISFGNMNVAINRPMITPDIIAYITPEGKLVVKSDAASVKSLTLFSTEGKILQKTASSTMFIGSLTANIYLLQVETTQGVVVKKIIKQ